MAGPTHLSARELAELKLDGLPTSRYRIDEQASREGWSAIARTGRGGGRRYAIADLPVRARRDLAARADDRATPPRGRGRPKGSDFFTANPAVADAVEAIVASQKLAVPRVLEMLEVRFANLPSRRTLARFIATVERDKAALLASTRDPDAYKSRYKVALGRADGNVSHAHQVWELDTTKADVLTRGGRKMILQVIDRWSRRARFLVVESESGQSVRRLLVDTMTRWGVMPECVATDNGAGFINQSICSALATLGIEHFICPPGTPEKKPFVERMFGTFTRERAELLAGYAGHSVADAQKLRAKAKKDTGRAVIVPELEPDELQAILDSWTDGVYHRRVHSTLRMTPMAKWQSSPVPARAAPAADILRVALSARIGTAVVGKRGVQWKRGRYWAEALVPFIGRVVELRYDEDDLGAIFVFDEDGQFIDTAVNAERSGLSEEARAREATRQQREWMKVARADIREKQRAFGLDEVKRELLRRDAEAAENVIAMPRPTAAHSTPALDSIAARPEPIAPDPVAVEAAMRKTAPPPRAETVADKVARADRILAAATRGEAVDPTDLRKAQVYATSAEYRAEKMVLDAFAARPAATTTVSNRRKA